jgi:hypothetical protein
MRLKSAVVFGDLLRLACAFAQLTATDALALC